MELINLNNVMFVFDFNEKKKDRQRRKKIIDDYIDLYHEEKADQAQKIYKRLKEKAIKKNGICPRCGSSRVYTFVKERGSSVNKCKVSGRLKIQNYIIPTHFVYLVEKCLNLSYNPYDPAEDFDSLDEKRENFKNRFFQEYMNLPPEVIDYIGLKNIL